MPKVASTPAAPTTTQPSYARSPRKDRIDPLSNHGSGLPVYQVARNWIDEIRSNSSRRGRGKLLGAPIELQCPVCNVRPPPIPYELIRHAESHLRPQDKEFQCPYPGCTYQGASQRCNLDNHVRSIHTKIKRTCDVVLKQGAKGETTYICGWSTTDGGRMTRHRQECHGYPTLKERRAGKSKPKRATKKNVNVVHVPCTTSGEPIWPADVQPPTDIAPLKEEEEEEEREASVHGPEVPSHQNLGHDRSPYPQALPATYDARHTPSRSPSPAPAPVPRTGKDKVIMIPYVYSPENPEYDNDARLTVDPARLTLPSVYVPGGVLRPLPVRSSTEPSYVAPTASSSTSPSTSIRSLSNLRYSPYQDANNNLRSSPDAAANNVPTLRGCSVWSEREYRVASTLGQFGRQYERNPSSMAAPSYSSGSYNGGSYGGGSYNGGSYYSSTAAPSYPTRHYPPPAPWCHLPAPRAMLTKEEDSYSDDYDEDDDEYAAEYY